MYVKSGRDFVNNNLVFGDLERKITPVKNHSPLNFLSGGLFQIFQKCELKKQNGWSKIFPRKLKTTECICVLQFFLGSKWKRSGIRICCWKWQGEFR